MRHCQIQCNFGGIDDLCKLGKDYLTALNANYAGPFRQNSETFDVLHAFLSTVVLVAKLFHLRNSPVFLAHHACNDP